MNVKSGEVESKPFQHHTSFYVESLHFMLIIFVTEIASENILCQIIIFNNIKFSKINILLFLSAKNQ